MKNLISQLILGSLAIFAMVLFKDSPGTTLVVLLMLALAMNWLSGWRLMRVFVIAAILGSIGEYLTTSHGVWTYASQQYLGLPFFIPIMWGICAVFFVSLANYLNATEEGN
jgi:hypothetical protein